MFYLRWVAACAAGELIGIGVGAAAAVGMNVLVGEPQTLPGRLAVLGTFAVVGAVEGGALAALQWVVLRTRLPRLGAAEWVGVTVAVAVTGWLVGMTPSLFWTQASDVSDEPTLLVVLMLASLVGMGAGLCFGAAQWFVLRRHAERAARWIWIHVPAWALAMAAIFLGASLPTGEWSAWSIGLVGAGGGIAGGLLLGGVTGLVAGRLQPWVDERRWTIQGKVCAVTGANSGLGQQVALGLARLGGTVVLLVRRPAEGRRVRQSILAALPEADVSVIECDLGDMGSIRRAATQLVAGWERLDVLVHNAGATFSTRTLTPEGIEATLAVDVVGPFLLTSLLRDRLESVGGRVVTLTGIYQRRGRVDMDDLHFARRPYGMFSANNQAQRARFLFMWELARRSPRLVTAAVHPGAVVTGAQARLPPVARALIKTLARPAFVRAEVGAIPVLRAAAHPDASVMSGRFFDRCRQTPDVPDAALAEAFWAACENMTDRHATRQSASGSVEHGPAGA